MMRFECFFPVFLSYSPLKFPKACRVDVMCLWFGVDIEKSTNEFQLTKATMTLCHKIAFPLLPWRRVTQPTPLMVGDEMNLIKCYNTNSC